MEKVIVEFTIRDRAAFDEQLQQVFYNSDNVPGIRTDIHADPAALRVFMPEVLYPIAPVIHRFFDAMIYKLRRNAHKGSLSELDLQQSLVKLREEIDELVKAMQESNQIEVLLEAADCANFAMILASIAIEGKRAGDQVLGS